MRNVLGGSGLARWATLGAAAASLLGAGAAAASPEGQRERGSRPSFSVKPNGLLDPGFAWRKHDYVVRCTQEQGTLKVRGAKGWRAKVGGGGEFRPGAISEPLGAAPDERTRVIFRRSGHHTDKHRFHLRCLPSDFPEYEFSRTGEGGPPFFAIQMDDHYAVIFNHDGVPVWWYQDRFDTYNVEVLPDGTVAWDPVDDITFQKGNYEIRSLTGRLLRTVSADAGALADVHELIALDNGNYLIGKQSVYRADTSAFGGSPDSEVTGIEILEMTPEGDVAYRWRSRDHIAVEETPQRWWDSPILDNEPYDITHWNSVEYDGKYMILSFRHLDAIYKVNRKTGNIVWKLGGTETPQSLEVLNDPHGDDIPLGGQHDARVLPNGTITIHDNRTGLPEPPRVLRYRIDEDAGTAELVQSFGDPEIPFSICCGSARRIAGGEWLVGWGGNGVVGAYERSGERIFKFSVDSGFSYRTNPVAEGVLTSSKLRRSMDRMASRP